MAVYTGGGVGAGFHFIAKIHYRNKKIRACKRSHPLVFASSQLRSSIEVKAALRSNMHPG